MAKLHLRIVTRHGQTRTLFGKAKDYDEMVFHNDSEQVLRVEFNPTNVICDDNGLVADFEVNPHGKRKVAFVPGAPAGTEVKYTAKIGTSDEEDPIIIIE